MLQNRHLDQIIICSFYVNCRVEGLDVKFNEIKQKYEEVNPYNKSLHEELIFKVYMEDQSPVDIIKFYNNVFIVKMKRFTRILAEKGQGTIHQTPGRKNIIMQSPLKSIIPRQLNNRQNKKTIGGKSNLTPHSNLLYAYN